MSREVPGVAQDVREEPSAARRWTALGLRTTQQSVLPVVIFVDVELSEGSPRVTGSAASGGGSGAVKSALGTSPYATGGGGVTFERRVAVQYLAHLLVGDGASELGDGRYVVSVEFQQAPNCPVDDLVVHAARADESQPSLVLALGVRRSPDLVVSEEPTRMLFRQFVRAVLNAPSDGPERRLCLVVAGPQPHAKQLAKLADLATKQMDAPGFFDLVRTPGRFDAGVRGRLDQIEKLVKGTLHDLSEAEAAPAIVQQRAWQLLARLTVSMPRLESPDETDWSAVANSLTPVARRSDLTAASRLRDRLVALASDYAPIWGIHLTGPGGGQAGRAYSARRAIRYSMGRSPLIRLQDEHSSWRLSIWSVPPRLCGITWSTSNAR